MSGQMNQMHSQETLNPRSRGTSQGTERARSRPAGISPWLFVTATAVTTMVASVLAVVITLDVVRQERAGVEGQDIPAPPVRSAPPAREAAPVTAAARPISLLPVGAPDQPLRLEPGRPTPLPLQLVPAEAANTPFIIALSGAPAGTTLFGGNRMSADTWYLPPGALNQLQIAVPEWSTAVIEITVLLRASGGDVVAKTQAWVSVLAPAAATPAADQTNVKELLAKADRLIAKGDVVGARAIYQRTAEMGSGAGALALGGTYDPNRLWSLGILGLTGNKERARRWYQRAGELGNPDAKARLEALGL